MENFLAKIAKSFVEWTVRRALNSEGSTLVIFAWLVSNVIPIVASIEAMDTNATVPCK